ncbi:DNA mismatch repair protein pms1 [Nosema bombycis CQ1]|uniref:DNA mismatch repair protein pms1 n=1 Tax=Nosema bombycis (strain CQ1 / CVCC 102059) TaxID=578461 RepID=R0KNQ0_NOSB1|nr:DNA mismatch repair protein pms1 [Nosema bombycis CQ1]|eukprot:EOB11797.1 DNA mismatch repair protein pms1 [Nosema bombycis CQ1]
MFNDITVIKNRDNLPEIFEVEDTLVSNSDITFVNTPIPSDSFSSPMLKNINLRLQTKSEQKNTVREYLDSPKSEKYQQEEDVTAILKDYNEDVNVEDNNTMDNINTTTSLELTTNAFSYLKFINPFTDNIHIIKSDFLKMKVIGQFNKGFILTSLIKDGRNLLLLIDQHAADEIYNYEVLKATMKINKQKLLIPIKINLSPIDELYLQDKSIEKWGFEIKNNELVAVPQLGEVLFGISDLMSIIENLKNDKCEFEKLHDIYATKACRSSVMIGEGLSYSKMCSIIENLGRIVNPWKCPHGRPTFIILKDL